MNWVGGVRNRLKVQNDKRQKEFFEKRKFQSRVENASRSPGNRGGVNTDLLSIKTISRTHTEGTSKTGILSASNSRRISVVDLNDSHRTNRLCNIELPNMSPIKKPSMLKLMESESSQPMDDPCRKKASVVLDKWALPQQRLARKPVFSSTTPAHTTKPADSYYDHSVSRLGSASRGDVSRSSSSSYDESIGNLTQATPLQPRTIPNQTYARKYELSDIEPDTPFLPYSKPGPRSVMFNKPGGKDDLFSRPSHVDGPLTSTPLCGTRTIPTMRAMATSEKGGLRLHPSYRPNENFSSRKRQLDKLISIEEFQVTPLKKYAREAERKSENPEPRNLDFPTNPLSAAVDDVLFNKGCQRTMYRQDIYNVPLRDNFHPMLASAAPTMSDCVPEGAEQPPTKEITIKISPSDTKCLLSGHRSITLPGPEVGDNKPQSTSDRWEKVCSANFISPLQLPDTKGDRCQKPSQLYDSDESVLSPITQKDRRSDITNRDTRKEQEHTSEVRKTPIISTTEKKSWLSFLSGGVKRKEKISWEQKMADKEESPRYTKDMQLEPFKGLSETLKNEMMQTLGEPDKALLASGDKIESFCPDSSSGSPRPSPKTKTLSVPTSQPTLADRVRVKETVCDISAPSLAAQPTSIDPSRKRSHESLSDRSDSPGDKARAVSHVSSPSRKHVPKTAQLIAETTKCSELNNQAAFLNLYHQQSPVFPSIIKTLQRDREAVKGFIQGLLHGLVADVTNKASDTDTIAAQNGLIHQPQARNSILEKPIGQDEILEDPLSNELSGVNENLEQTRVKLKDSCTKNSPLKGCSSAYSPQQRGGFPLILPKDGQHQSSMGIQVNELLLPPNCTEGAISKVDKAVGYDSAVINNAISVGVQATYTDITKDEYVNVQVQTADWENCRRHVGVQVERNELINQDSKAVQVNEPDLGVYSSKGLQVDRKSTTECLTVGVQVDQSTHQSRHTQVDQSEFVCHVSASAAAVQTGAVLQQGPTACQCVHAVHCTYSGFPNCPPLPEPISRATSPNDAMLHRDITLVTPKARQGSQTAASSPTPVIGTRPTDELLSLPSSDAAPGGPAGSRDTAAGPDRTKPFTTAITNMITSDNMATKANPNLPYKADTSQSQPIDLSTKHDNLLKLLRKERKRIRTELASEQKHATTSPKCKPSTLSSESDPKDENVACELGINKVKCAARTWCITKEQLPPDASQVELCHADPKASDITEPDASCDYPLPSSDTDSEGPSDLETLSYKGKIKGESLRCTLDMGTGSAETASGVLCYTESGEWKDINLVQKEKQSGSSRVYADKKYMKEPTEKNDMNESCTNAGTNKDKQDDMGTSSSTQQSEQTENIVIVEDSQSSGQDKEDCSETECYFSLDSDPEMTDTDHSDPNNPSNSNNREKALDEQLKERAEQLAEQEKEAVIVEGKQESGDKETNEQSVSGAVGVPLAKYRLRSWRQREV